MATLELFSAQPHALKYVFDGVPGEFFDKTQDELLADATVGTGIVKAFPGALRTLLRKVPPPPSFAEWLALPLGPSLTAYTYRLDGSAPTPILQFLAGPPHTFRVICTGGIGESVTAVVEIRFQHSISR
jgi:hypothetical protein